MALCKIKLLNDTQWRAVEYTPVVGGIRLMNQDDIRYAYAATVEVQLQTGETKTGLVPLEDGTIHFS